MLIKEEANKARIEIINASKLAGVGHIGSALSIIDILLVIYQRILRCDDIESNNRDRFILSKGHAALSLYVALLHKGLISDCDFKGYCQNNSFLGVHPKHFVPAIDFSSGSLGQGVTYSVGAALAAKIEGSSRMVYCLLSDAEINEGSFWEAIMFAAHHKLSNLVFILDNNGQQALGFTDKIININDIDHKIKSFGFAVETIDGHDFDEIESSLIRAMSSNLPNFIVANTISGKGISFMEKKIEWHYKSLNDEHYKIALQELN